MTATRCLIVLGVRRSGNHAIANWLFPMIGKYFYINNMSIKDLTFQNFVQHRRNAKNLPNTANHHLVPFSADTQTILIGLEELDLEKVRPCVDQFRKDSGMKTDLIVLLRNPFHMLASLWKCSNGRKTQLQYGKTRWKQYVRTLLTPPKLTSSMPTRVSGRSGGSWGERREARVSVPNVGSPPLKVIYFDQWFTCRKYRQKICQQLGLTLNDKNFNQIFSHGVSSFDGLKYQNDTTKMKVLQRFEVFANNAEFMAIANDNEMKTLHQKLTQLVKCQCYPQCVQR